MGSDKQDYYEKRDFIRMFINTPVDFAIAGSDKWYKGIGNDLSGGGMSFTTEQQLSTGDMVEIKLHPITPVTPPLEAIIEVIRADESEDGQYEISAKIDKIVS